ncbi:phenazine biosynthesis protein PhzF like [Nonlabens marinus S1-08]|uniref:Phenazine biosynthesis protein PhzF like n=2 Tax=Nonlabens TaxID=363408 RepID=W8VWI2_9FLAO|nr:phenazine biosynthesis protein PhzF like [Nonlabens marinus S1-08]
MVDSFAREPFKGNPAGVCLLDESLSNDLMQSIAVEVNLSETAFVQDQGDSYSIRYFSPIMEIPLCGHATLASAKILFQQDADLNEIKFQTSSGLELRALRNGEKVSLKFPNYGIIDREVPKSLLDAMGIKKINNSGYNHENLELMIELEDANELRNLKPDFAVMKASIDDISGVVVTAKSNQPDLDFESRYFWPWSGGDEDPVTGATHTFLTGYWSKKFGKTKLRAFQCSARTGILEVEVLNDQQILITGNARIVLKGEMTI